MLLDLTQLRGVTQDEVDLQFGVDVLGAIDAATVECLGAAEDSGQGVVVGRGDRVKLVVVAPGTGNCQSQHGLANHIQLVVDDVQRDVAAVERFLSDRQQSRRHLQPPGFGRVSGLQQVTGKLFDQEPVVGDVGVDRVDHVVAVPPRPKHQHVPAAASRFGEAGHVQPVPGPAFSETGRCEQFVDDLAVGGRRVVGCERVQLFGCWRQADQVEVHSPQQRFRRGIGDGCQVGGFHPCQQEPVDVGLWPFGIFDRWHFRT